jgi:hypothetical protein
VISLAPPKHAAWTYGRNVGGGASGKLRPRTLEEGRTADAGTKCISSDYTISSAICRSIMHHPAMFHPFQRDVFRSRPNLRINLVELAYSQQLVPR